MPQTGGRQLIAVKTAAPVLTKADILSLNAQTEDDARCVPLLDGQ